MSRWALIFLLACLRLSVFAQIQIVPKEKLDAVNKPELSADAGSMSFETISIRADIMNEDDGIHTYVYRFENIGESVLNIKRLVSTCSCAVAYCEKEMVRPGEKAEIVVRFNPKGHPGRFERRVFVYTGTGSAPAAILSLFVDVQSGTDLSGLYPVSMGNIRLRRNEVTFVKGVRAVERCVFVNVTDRPLILDVERLMLPSCLDFKVEPATVEAGDEGVMIITYDPSESGERTRMPVMLKGLGVPPSQSVIDVRLKDIDK